MQRKESPGMHFLFLLCHSQIKKTNSEIGSLQHVQIQRRNHPNRRGQGVGSCFLSTSAELRINPWKSLFLKLPLSFLSSDWLILNLPSLVCFVSLVVIYFMVYVLFIFLVWFGLACNRQEKKRKEEKKRGDEWMNDVRKVIDRINNMEIYFVYNPWRCCCSTQKRPKTLFR